MNLVAMYQVGRCPIVRTLAVFLAVGFAPSREAAAEPVKTVRTPWTSSRVVGSPDPPPPFKVVRVFPRLKFDHPLLIVRMPGSNRLVVGEQNGALYSFRDNPDTEADLFFDLRKEDRKSVV